MLLLLMLVALPMLVSGLNTISISSARDDRTALVLAKAKEAVISLNLASTTLPGRLPCPEDTSLIGTANEGNQRSSCSNALPEIGRLPWRSLKVDQLRDGYGEPLWYVISPGFRAAPINTTTAGQLTIDGHPGGYAALIIAPGPPLDGQNRGAISAGSPPLSINYLEGTNADGDASFSIASASINDRILGVTTAELMAPVGRRVLAQIRGPDDSYPTTPSSGLRNFHSVNGNFPYADTDANGSADGTATVGNPPYAALTPVMWLNSNQWWPLVSYERIDANCVRLSLSGMQPLYAVPCTTAPCQTNICP
jgi:hypothetical protein